MSRMPRKWTFASITILVLLGIGLCYVLINSPGTFVIPVLVLGGIFLLYKYPPSFLGGNGRRTGRTQVKHSRATAAKTSKPRSKRADFRVIEGGKDNDDLPKYH